MTREEMIQRLKTTDACDVDLCEALEMAIEALEQEPCEDCISREAVIKTIAEWFFSKEFHYTNAAEYLRKRLDKLPSVTPQQKIGKWVKTIGENGVTSAIRCSWCGFEDNRYELFNYCPNCGCKMQEVEE